MRFNIIVGSAGYGSLAPLRALRFSDAAIAKGHHISEVFFIADGVLQASCLVAVLDDELDLLHRWQVLAQHHRVSLKVCISASERRGILNTEQAQDLHKRSFNMADCFHVAGLATMHQSSLQADRTVTFL